MYLFQDVLFALCGFFFFIGFGSKMCEFLTSLPYTPPEAAQTKGLAAMAIITSVVYLVDLAFGVMKLFKND